MMNNKNRIPQLLTDFRVFFGEGGNQLIGNADVTLPDLAFMEETVKVSGIAGELSLPVTGMLQSMSTEIKWTTISRQCAELDEPKAMMLTLRGSQQLHNPSTGRSDNQPISIIMKVMPKQLGLGKFENASATDTSNSFEVLSLKLLLDNREYIHVDKLNYICKINGTDYLSAVRNNLGLT